MICEIITIILMMPQFDTFSFCSQLFWIFISFCYLYLMLSFYLLPAFAIILKTRAKMLLTGVKNSNSSELANKASNSNFANFVFGVHNENWLYLNINSVTNSSGWLNLKTKPSLSFISNYSQKIQIIAFFN